MKNLTDEEVENLPKPPAEEPSQRYARSNGYDYAYPLQESTHPDEIKGHTYNGLSKRELFATMAMQGLCANAEISKSVASRADLAAEAVRSADALLLALESIPAPGAAQ